MIIYHAQNCGLCNRLRALIGYMAVSNATSQEFRLLWQRDDGCPCEFEDIIEASCVKTISQEEATDLLNKGDAEIQHSHKCFDKIYNENQSVNSTMPWQEFRLLSLKYLAQLKPSRNVSKIIEGFYSSQRVEALEGIHVRQTDNLNAYSIWAGNHDFSMERVSRIEGFIQYMKTKARGEQKPMFFIASDNPEVKNLIHAELGLYATSLDVKFRPPEAGARSTSMEIATAELFILSSCKKIIGTYYSSFSKMCALINQVDYLVVEGFDTAVNAHYEFLRGHPQQAI